MKLYTAKEYIFDVVNYKVIDGDTVKAQIDLGFGITLWEKFRIYGINTPELSGLTEEGGKAAKEMLEKMFNVDNVVVQVFKSKTGTEKQEKYGRYLGDFWVRGEEYSFGQRLISEGLAKEYYGEKKQ